MRVETFIPYGPVAEGVIETIAPGGQVHLAANGVPVRNARGRQVGRVVNASLGEGGITCEIVFDDLNIIEALSEGAGT